jgi:anti-sigma factor RsiW
MSEPQHDDLERLISRCLDEECTPQEHRTLNARLRRDPSAAALFEEHSALDREVGHALRRALRHTSVRPRALPLWERAARICVVAAAACLAMLFWLRPGGETSVQQAGVVPGAPSWFASPPTVRDALIESPERFDRPQIRVGQPDINWIVVPSDKPGEFLVIEVNRVLTRTVHIHQDF